MFQPTRTHSKLSQSSLTGAALTMLACNLSGCSSGPGNQEDTISDSEAALNTCTIPPACPEALGGCEAPTWPGGIIYYRFTNPDHPDAVNVQYAMQDWSTATQGAVQFVESLTLPASSIATITVLDPGNGGVSGTGPGSSASMSAGAAYHELGHTLGLYAHEFERRDRDHYDSINHTAWYDKQGNSCSMYPRCSDPDGDFGPHDFRSAMSYKVSDPDITRWDFTPLSGAPCLINSGFPETSLWFTRACPATACATGSPGTITLADAGKVVEMYRYGSGNWDKFRRTNNESDVAANAPFPSYITGAVKLIGSPAVATMDGGAKLQIFARGSDNRIYTKSLTSFGPPAVWSGWTSPTKDTFNSDPAAVSWGSGRIDLVARKSDNNLYLWTYSNGSWSSAASIGAPSAKAASSPAITSWGPGRLDVFVRGADNKLYTRTCSTTGTNCSPSSGHWNAWTQVSSSATFRGKPAAIAGRSAGIIDVFVHGTDDHLWGVEYGGSWLPFYQVNLSGTLGWYNYPGVSGSCNTDDCYSPAVTGRPDGIDVVIRGGDTKAWVASYTVGSNWVGYTPIGGVLTSSPALPTKARTTTRIDLVATMDEERDMDVFVPTMWWKQYPKP